MKQRNGILIVDDTLSTLKLLADTLISEKYRVRPVTSGAQALESINAELPELILLDIRMPGMDGFEVCKRLKAGEATRAIPILFLSATTDAQERVQGFELGGVDFIPKPFQRAELLARVRTHLELSRLQVNLEELVAQRTKELQASEEKFSKAFRCSPVACSIVSLDDRRVLDVNNAFCDTTGYGPGEIMGRFPEDLSLWVDPEIRQRMFDDIRSQGGCRGLDFRFQTKDGEIRTGILSAEAIEFGGRPCILTAAEDITERVLLEEQLRQAQKMEAVGQLAGGVAHDFNNILAAMQMTVGFLQTEPGLPASVLSGLQALQLEAERASGLTRQLLLFSRRQRALPSLIDLNEIVKNMISMLGRLLGSRVRLEVVSDNALHRVHADPGMIEQVIMNLCVNARDAMPNGGRVIVGLSRERVDRSSPPGAADEHGVFVRLSVTDEGVGIKPAVLRHLFEPFFTTKEPGKGTGLGLSTVSGIVKQHHGWIDVDSAEGKGSTFHVFIPALSEVGDDACKLAEEPLAPGGSETILMVGERELLGREMVLSLRKLGYGVFDAEDSECALKIWTDHGGQIDLMIAQAPLTDGGAGVELARKLRAEKKNLGVLMLAPQGQASQEPDSGSPAVDEFPVLPMPCHAARLAAVVRSCLDATSTSSRI